jgi:acyl-CoA synthetase (NDP forming)
MATEAFHDEAKLRKDLPPVYRFPESAARALAQLDRYASWRRTPEELEIPLFEVDDKAVSELLDETDEGYLPPDSAFRILEHYGIPVAPWRFVKHAADVHLAAADVGYPLVVKAIAPDLVHKSDAGGVELDLRNSSQLEQALERMSTSLSQAGVGVEGYLVQQMVSGGHEVIFGISTDPRFGPLLMFGRGGRYVEVLQDVRFGVVPLRPDEAAEMIRGIRGFALLEGVRGEPGADLGQLEEILLRIAQLAQRHPRIQELDINPFLAGPDPEAAVAVDVRVRVGADDSTDG